MSTRFDFTLDELASRQGLRGLTQRIDEFMARASRPAYYNLEARHQALLLTDLRHIAIMPHSVADYVAYDLRGHLVRPTGADGQPGWPATKTIESGALHATAIADGHYYLPAAHMLFCDGSWDTPVQRDLLIDLYGYAVHQQVHAAALRLAEERRQAIEAEAAAAVAAAAAAAVAAAEAEAAENQSPVRDQQ